MHERLMPLMHAEKTLANGAGSLSRVRDGSA